MDESVVVDVELPVDDVPVVEDVVFELDDEGVVAVEFNFIY